MNIAFIGFRHGHVYSMLRQVQDAPGVSVAALCESDEASVAEARERGVIITDSDYLPLLKRPDIDAVAICDYYSARGGEIIAALKSGKHVYADKPLCTSLAELDEIERLSREGGLKVGCMLDLRYAPSTAAAKEAIGRIGRIHNVMFCGQHSLNYGTRPSWYFEKGKHGGTVNDIAVHGIDLVRYLAGLSVEKPLFTRCWNAYALQVPEFKDSSELVAQLTGGAGLVADVSYSQPYPLAFTPEQSWRFTFWGEDGTLEFNMAHDEAFLTLKNAEGIEVVKAQPPASDTFLDFLSDVNGSPRELCTAEVLKSSRDTLLLQSIE